MTTVAELVTRVNGLKTKVDEAAGKQTTSSDKLTTTQTDIEGKAAEAKSYPDESRAYKTRAEAAKPKVSAIPGINDITKELHKFAVPEPDFCLPLVSNLDLERGFGDVTFTRSTTATYIDKTGVLRTAKANEPRFERQGILIEGSSTNLLPYSDHEKSFASLSNLKNPPIKHFQWGVMPFFKIIFPNNNTHISGGMTSAKVDQGTYTASVYLKKPATPQKIIEWYKCPEHGRHWYNLETFETNDPSGKVIHVNDDIFVLTSTLNLTKQNTVNFHFYSTHHTRFDGSQYLSLGGYQLEKLPFATSYIPTTGSAVTRGMDKLGSPFKNTDKPHTIFGELHCIGHSSNYAKMISNYSNGGRVEYGSFNPVDPSLRIMAYRSIIPKSEKEFQIGTGIINDYKARPHFSFAVRDDGNILNGFADGNQYGEAKGPTLGSTGSTMYFGQSGQAFFHLRNFRIWHHALTPDQIAML